MIISNKTVDSDHPDQPQQHPIQTKPTKKPTKSINMPVHPKEEEATGSKLRNHVVDTLSIDLS